MHACLIRRLGGAESTIGRPRVVGTRQSKSCRTPARSEDPLATRQSNRLVWTGRNGLSRSSLALLCGIIPGALCRSAMSWSAILLANCGRRHSCALMSKPIPSDILRWFVRRWSIEVTFAEVRRHLGVESQRQWSDPAIARTTPALLGLFSLVTLWAHELYANQPVMPRAATWYTKPLPTFSDAIALVRRELWTTPGLDTSANGPRVVEIPRATISALIGAACYAA